jgi:heme exporter protein A
VSRGAALMLIKASAPTLHLDWISIHCELSVPACPSPAAAVLHAVDLAGQRGARTLFEHLHVELAPGTVTWLRGRNGSGKTSLLRLLAGLATPLAGEVRVRGDATQRRDPSWRRGLLYIGHQNAAKDDLGAAEALAFLMRLAGAPPSAREVEAALQRLGLHAKRRALVHTLSQGQRRRLALARLALSLATPLWLLDEPFDALDVEGIACLNELLAEHAARGGATLLTSHQPLSLAAPLPLLLDLDRPAGGHGRP